MSYRNKAPCRDCTERTIEPNCHMTCEIYLSYRREHEEIKEKMQKDTAPGWQISDTPRWE